MSTLSSVSTCFCFEAQTLPSPHHLLVQPPFTPLGAVQPLQGLTKILRALTFAGHLAHPHQSVEVALCSICDTWKHGSIGHQIKGAELKRPLLQLCNPPQRSHPAHSCEGGHGKQSATGGNGDQARKKLYGGRYREQMKRRRTTSSTMCGKENPIVPATTPENDYITMTRWIS